MNLQSKHTSISTEALTDFKFEFVISYRIYFAQSIMVSGPLIASQVRKQLCDEQDLKISYFLYICIFKSFTWLRVLHPCIRDIPATIPYKTSLCCSFWCLPGKMKFYPNVTELFIDAKMNYKTIFVSHSRIEKFLRLSKMLSIKNL